MRPHGLGSVPKFRTLTQALNFLFPKPEQANDVKAWAERRVRRMRARRKKRAA